ncbi:MAG: hypothetical protein FWD33_00780 [Alphaproteobacteria bacterium]|nr:hypothetical protein [Alphaproteobacteria bacterium]
MRYAILIIFAALSLPANAKIDCSPAQFWDGRRCRFCPKEGRVQLIPNATQTGCVRREDYIDESVTCSPNEFQTMTKECIPCDSTQISLGNRCEFCPWDDVRKVQLIPNETQTKCILPIMENE